MNSKIRGLCHIFSFTIFCSHYDSLLLLRVYVVLPVQKLCRQWWPLTHRSSCPCFLSAGTKGVKFYILNKINALITAFSKGCIYGLVVESIECYSREPGFNSQYTQGSQLSANSASVDIMTSYGLTKHQANMQNTEILAGKAIINIKKKLFKRK